MSVVAGPVSKDENGDWSAEIQIVGGHELLATVYGPTKEDAEQNQAMLLAALSQRPSPHDEGVTSDCELCVGKCRGHRLGHPEDWEPEPGSRAARSQVIAEAKELLREENELAFSTRPLEEIARRRFDIMQAKAAILPRLLTLIEGGGK